MEQNKKSKDNKKKKEKLEFQWKKAEVLNSFLKG